MQGASRRGIPRRGARLQQVFQCSRAGSARRNEPLAARDRGRRVPARREQPEHGTDEPVSRRPVHRRRRRPCRDTARVGAQKVTGLDRAGDRESNGAPRAGRHRAVRGPGSCRPDERVSAAASLLPAVELLERARVERGGSVPAAGGSPGLVGPHARTFPPSRRAVPCRVGASGSGYGFFVTPAGLARTVSPGGPSDAAGRCAGAGARGRRGLA